MNTDTDKMNAITTPYPEPDTKKMEMQEALYYDNIDVNKTFPKPKKYVRQFNAPAVDIRGGFDFDLEEERHIDDLIANLTSCYPTLHLKDIAEKLNHVYTDSESMESFVSGQRIGDYEYIVSQTNYCKIIFGRKHPTDDYITIHYWLIL